MKSKKVAVLTRAANGIGKAIAIEFARDGYTVMINDIAERQVQHTVKGILSSLSETTSTKKDMKNNNIVDYNNCISYFTGDTSKEKVSVSLIEETIKRFGRIDVLINNAIISQQSIASQSYEIGAAATSTSSNYQKQDRSSPYFTLEEYGLVDTNLKGIYFCIRAFVKQLLLYTNLNADGAP